MRLVSLGGTKKGMGKKKATAQAFRIVVDRGEMGVVRELKALLILRGMTEAEWILEKCREDVEGAPMRLISGEQLIGLVLKKWGWVISRGNLFDWRAKHWTENEDYFVKEGKRSVISYDRTRVMAFLSDRVPSEARLASGQERKKDREAIEDAREAREEMESSGPKIRGYQGFGHL